MSEFLTTDLQLASFLVTLGHRPARVEGPSHRRVFVFHGVPEEDTAAYFRSTRAVDAQTLFRAYRQLKHQLHQQPA